MPATKKRKTIVSPPSCDMCGGEIEQAGSVNRLKGICAACDKLLGGGKCSAPIVRQEVRQMRKERNDA